MTDDGVMAVEDGDADEDSVADGPVLQ